jgi:hypothetical protein
VLGQFPAAGTHSLISLSWLEDMDRVKRVDGPWALGVDVARSGMDQTVLALMRGNALVHLEAWQGQDTMRTAGRVKMFWDALRWVEPGTMRPKRVRTPEEEARINAMRLEAEDEHYEYWRRNAPSSYGPFKLTAVKPPKFVWRDPDEPEPPASHRVTIAIDDGGVGGGVVDRLREQDVPVHAVTFGAAAEKRHEGSGKFRNRVSELYWTLREELREGRLYFGATVTPSRPEEGTEGMVLAVRPEMKAKLWAQLMQIEWEVESDRAVRVHKRGLDGHGRSPDVADAVALVVEAKNRDRISGRSRVQIFL